MLWRESARDGLFCVISTWSAKKGMAMMGWPLRMASHVVLLPQCAYDVEPALRENQGSWLKARLTTIAPTAECCMTAHCGETCTKWHSPLCSRAIWSR